MSDPMGATVAKTNLPRGLLEVFGNPVLRRVSYIISLLCRLIHTQSEIYKQASHQCYTPRLGNFVAPHPMPIGITTFICLSGALLTANLRYARHCFQVLEYSDEQEKACRLFLGEQCGTCCGCTGGSPCPLGVRGRAFQKKHLWQVLEEK